MTNVALNNLWTYIQSLNLTEKNRKWLSEKLVEPSKPVATERQVDMVTSSFRQAMSEVAEAEKNGGQMESLNDLIAELEAK